MKKYVYLISIFLFLISVNAYSQNGVAINTDGSSADSKALLDVKSTEKGILIPRMTRSQRSAISSPTTGLIVYDTDSLSLYYYHNGWHEVLDGGNSSAYVDIDDGGFLTLVDTATVWDDIMVPGLSVAKVVASQPTLANFPSSQTTTQLYSFGDGGTEYVYFTVQIPHRWKEGSKIYPHVHFSPATGGTVSGSVVWVLDYYWSNVNSTFAGTSGSIDLTSVIGSVSHTTDVDKHLIASYASGLTPTTNQDEISTMFVCRLSRKSSDAYTGNVFLLQFDVHYETNSIGSRQPFLK